ncbi:MAG: tRNA epoxyqueuosine(34) reductase QueG, partial [Candidatus Dormibacteria bacterium]
RERFDAAGDLRRRYPWAASMLALAWPYRPAGEAPAPGRGRPTGRIAAYACLREDRLPIDYHAALGRRCLQLGEWIAGQHPGVRMKRFIDHGWAMDKPAAERAGIGFIGKNTTLLTSAAGSYVVLAEILLSLPLPPTAPSLHQCGSCSACLPACPTGALLAPGVMDARRCISYLTIEHEGPIPVELRPLMGTWIFGCDLCQEACPVNQRLAPGPADPEPPAAGPVPFPDLVRCLELSDEGFRARFANTSVARSGRSRLARNAAIALGNACDPDASDALRRAASSDPDEVVREAAAWSLGQIASRR